MQTHTQAVGVSSSIMRPQLKSTESAASIISPLAQTAQKREVVRSSSALAMKTRVCLSFFLYLE